PARQKDDAGAERAAPSPSARKIPGDRGQWPHPRGNRIDRRVPGAELSPGFGAAKWFGCILAIQILAALCRRLTHAAAAPQTRDQQARTFGTAGQTVYRRSAETSSRLLGKRITQGPVVPR